MVAHTFASVLSNALKDLLMDNLSVFVKPLAVKTFTSLLNFMGGCVQTLSVL